MGYTIAEVLDAGGDVLLVRATDADGNEVEAAGWVSATTNHYDPSAYSSDPETGELVRDEKAEPRAMTPAEVGAYALSLLPPAAAAATEQATPIAFQ